MKSVDRIILAIFFLEANHTCAYLSTPKLHTRGFIDALSRLQIRKRIQKREISRNYWKATPFRVRINPRMTSDDNNNISNEKGDDEEGDKRDIKFIRSMKKFLKCTLFPKLSFYVKSKMANMLAFIYGVLLTFLIVFVPVYSENQAAIQPVTLLETIIEDIDKRYVEKVDTNRMFEVGVKAMLQSLDPYTQFENKKDAADSYERLDGKYGGVGLVISGVTPKTVAQIDSEHRSTFSTTQDHIDSLHQGNIQENGESINDGNLDSIDVDNEENNFLDRLRERKLDKKTRKREIRVVSAFEGYAFNYGLRVGDRLVAVDNKSITSDTSTEDVRNILRGEPGSYVEISFEREGVKGTQTITMPRTIVKIRDVKLATLLGNEADGIGYIQLTGFSQNAGREVREAITHLQRAAEDANDGMISLKGLILDLRGNPGGLMTSAVDISSLLLPRNSDIVSARGRGFPPILYRSRVDPIVDSSTKIAVLVNGGTASAAEIVTGAVQDLDAGIVVGSDRTFGKGLVQTVEKKPFDTSLKFTVAKYYTPSGRCIQGIEYKKGTGPSAEEGGKYIEKQVSAEDRSTFYTKNGREVKDGGGIEADYKVSAPKASALEITLLRSGVISDFATQWCKTRKVTSNFEVDEQIYNEFQSFVEQKQKEGDINLRALYNNSLINLKKALESSGYEGSRKEVEKLEARIVREVLRDFQMYRADIKEDISQAILARHLPQSKLIKRSIQTDKQVLATLKLIKNDQRFCSLLAKGSVVEPKVGDSNVLNPAINSDTTSAFRFNW